MLSGIGDSDTLSTFGIDTIIDAPDVGGNLQAGPFYRMYASAWEKK